MPVEIEWRYTWPDDEDAREATDLVALAGEEEVGRVYMAEIGGVYGTIWKWFVWREGVVPNAGHENSRREAMLAIEGRAMVMIDRDEAEMEPAPYCRHGPCV
jgi:hypothetical protein